MKIGIIGNGVVGNATAHALCKHVDEIRVHDSDPSRSTHALAATLECDLIFVCLPTPQKAGALECDTSALDSFFGSLLGAQQFNANYVIRSTVPIGYTRALGERMCIPNLVHWPEFLTARSANRDACNPTRIIIGQHHGYLDGAGPCYTQLVELCKETWPVPLFEVTSNESEAIKLFQNGFSAVKIAYFNEIRSLADTLKLDWNRCLSALLAGGWINPMHTQVPGPDGKRGFGGTCLPKDLANLAECLFQAGRENWVTSAALERNEVDRK